MKEIDTTEQRIDSSEVNTSPAHLREVRDRNAQKANRLDGLSSPQEIREGEQKGLTSQEREKINDIVSQHYDKARQITENATKDGKAGGERDYKGANFTDHNEAHVEQVEAKTTEALDACSSAAKAGKLERNGAEGDVHFSPNVDYKVTQAAALSHDTGMSNDGYHYNDKTGSVEKQNGQDFDSVRNNHCANSALNVLQNREQYKEAGFSDEQVNDIAMLTFSHSKSNSGIRDLNSSSDWETGVNRLEAFVDRYNADHLDNQITFDKEQFSDKEKLGVLATESISLRAGDVSRNSGPDAPAQSGEIVHVEKNPDYDISQAKTWEEETAGYNVTVGTRVLDCNDKNDRKSIQVHTGEQNIIDNHTEFDSNKVVHTITVNDGAHAPRCTQEAIKDHLGEFASAKNGDFVVRVEFGAPVNDAIIEKYNQFRTNIEQARYIETGDPKFPNITVLYPWDKE